MDLRRRFSELVSRARQVPPKGVLAAGLVLLLVSTGTAVTRTNDSNATPETRQTAAGRVPAEARAGTGVLEVSPPDPEPEPEPDPRPVPQSVLTVRPDVLVHAADTVTADELAAAAAETSTVRVTAAGTPTVRVRTAAGRQADLELLTIDPPSFRPLTPDVTAQTPGVWERLLDQELVLSPDVAHALQVAPADHVTLIGPSGRELRVRVGATASNGTPSLADGLLADTAAAPLGGTESDLLIAALDDGVEVSSAAETLTEKVGGGEVERHEEPATRTAAAGSAAGQVAGAGQDVQLEPFSYLDHGDGMITIDPQWVRRWIVAADLPIYGVARCHRLMMPQLIAALNEVVQRGLGHLLDASDYGACWVPRHILFDPSRSLSMHAWGLAVDLNVHTNQYGAEPQMDPRIVDIFERWGFEWGGRWSTPDGMHFQLDRIVRP